MTPVRWLQIRELLDRASQLGAPERSAFLDRNCSDDLSLRQEVEKLLAAEQELPSSFLESPAVARAPAFASTMSGSGLAAGTKLGPYTLETLLGAGGMGEVYRARDTRLDRTVAIKVIPRSLSSDSVRRQRFQREARAIASLQHPNICTLYDVGSQEGTDYLVMEYLEGETLSARLLKGLLPADLALRYAKEVADALDASHRRGIVHRDFKPGNIFITTHGEAKVLDFGLAKLGDRLAEVETATDTMLSTPGAAMGTVAYMSPEQARGQAADARSDMWSLGVVLYEMVTSARPFDGPTAAVVFEAILGKAPVPVRERNPQVDPELERIIGKLLEKDRASRYHSAASLRADLEGIRSLTVAGQNGKRGRDRESAVSHKGGVGRLHYALAAVLATIAFCAFLWHRSHPAPLTDHDVLVLADFTNKTGDPVFDGTLREALAIRLEESPFLKVISDEEMRQELRLMGHSPDQHITNDIAREVCIREGDKAMISGSIAGFGKTYAITLQATNCQSGAVLARGQVEAEDKDHVLKAVAAAGSDMRVKLGESLSSVQKLDRPFEQATTPSLAAFQAYSQGYEELQRGSYPAAARLFERATGLDPNFASAYDELGEVYRNMGDAELNDKYVERAFSLIDQVRSERERLGISVDYYRATGQSDKLADMMQLFARVYPRDSEQHAELGQLYYQNGEFKKAFQEMQELFRLKQKPSEIDYYNLMLVQILLDQLDEAKAVASKALAHGFDAPGIHLQLLVIAYTEGDRDAAANELRWFAGKPEESRLLSAQAQNAYSLGQRSKAQELYGRGTKLLESRGLTGAAARFLTADAVSDAVLGSCEAIRDASRTAALPYLNRDPAQPAVLGLAVCGEAAQARRVVDMVSKQFPADTQWNAVKAPSIQAAVALRGNNPAKAIELLQSAAPYERRYPYVMYLRGLAYLEAHDGGRADVEFRKILDHKGAYLILGSNGPYYPLSYLGLARAAAMSGDTAKSKKAYQDFFALWKDADPDLAPLIQARKEYAALP